jgi:hypothetical protein
MCMHVSTTNVFHLVWIQVIPLYWTSKVVVQAMSLVQEIPLALRHLN